VAQALAARGIRAELDGRNEKLGFKIREAETQKIPMMIVVGDQEVANGTVTPRRRHGSNEPSGAMPLDAFVAQIADEIATRRSH
jgi:threonyl-tRNA synthetase